MEDDRPWLVGFSGGKDEDTRWSRHSFLTLSYPYLPHNLNGKSQYRFSAPIHGWKSRPLLTRIEGALARMRKFSRQNDLNIEVNLLKPPPEQSFWVNVIGRGYPPPTRTFRWCTRTSEDRPCYRFCEPKTRALGRSDPAPGGRVGRKVPPVPRPWPAVKPGTASAGTRTCHAYGYLIPLSSSLPRKSGHTCFKSRICTYWMDYPIPRSGKASSLPEPLAAPASSHCNQGRS